jgi:hypothetical protein
MIILYVGMECPEITRDVDVSRLRWPASGCSSAVNRDYVDLSGITWADVRDAVRLEDEVLERLVSDPVGFDAALDDDTQLYEDICMTLRGVDVGVASTVFALSALGCLTCSSCSAYHPHHAESFPLVVFRARPQTAPLLLRVAEETGCGLENVDDGMLMLYAAELRQLSAFAKGLMRVAVPHE